MGRVKHSHLRLTWRVWIKYVFWCRALEEEITKSDSVVMKLGLHLWREACTKSVSNRIGRRRSLDEKWIYLPSTATSKIEGLVPIIIMTNGLVFQSPLIPLLPLLNCPRAGCDLKICHKQASYKENPPTPWAKSIFYHRAQLFICLGFAVYNKNRAESFNKPAGSSPSSKSTQWASFTGHCKASTLSHPKYTPLSFFCLHT